MKVVYTPEIRRILFRTEQRKTAQATTLATVVIAALAAALWVVVLWR